MNRRGFFSVIAGAVASIAVPVVWAGDRVRRWIPVRFVGCGTLPEPFRANVTYFLRDMTGERE